VLGCVGLVDLWPLLIPDAHVHKLAVRGDEGECGGPEVVARARAVEDVLTHAAPVGEVCVDFEGFELGQCEQLRSRIR